MPRRVQPETGSGSAVPRVPASSSGLCLLSLSVCPSAPCPSSVPLKQCQDSLNSLDDMSSIESQGTLVRSPFPKPHLPIQSTFATLFAPKRSRSWSDSRPAYIDGITHEVISFGDLKRTALRLAYALRHHPSLDLQSPTATVAVFAANCMEYPMIIAATQAAGIPCTTANSSYGQDELVHQIEESRATVLLVDSDERRLGIAKGASQATGVQLFLLNRSSPASTGLRSIFSLTGEDELVPVTMSERQAKETISVMCFSSGTTGKAKGVKVTHWNFSSSTEMHVASMEDCYLDADSNVWLGACWSRLSTAIA